MFSLAAARPVIARALAAAVGLTAAWGVVSGVTQLHFAYACLLVGVVLARVLTKAPASRDPLLPALAAILAFAVGFVGDFVAVDVALWLHFGLPAGLIADHTGEIFRDVAGSHSVMDWVFFLLAAIAAAGLTAGRQFTGADPLTRHNQPSPTKGREPKG